MPASFFSIGCEARLGDGNRLVKLSNLISWNEISQKLNGIHKNDINSQGGPIGYDKLKSGKYIKKITSYTEASFYIIALDILL